MTKTVAIVNQKGGVAKTTTAIHLAAGLHRKGYKVLGIDLDSQKSFSYTLRLAEDYPTIYEILRRTVTAEEAIQHTSNGDYIAASSALATVHTAITGAGQEYKLKEALQQLTDSGQYDYIILDTPPALSILTFNALTYAKTIVITAQPDVFSIKGIEQLAQTLIPIKQYTNPEIKLDGILLTRYSTRNLITKELTELFSITAHNISTKLYSSTIREAVAVKEAQANRQTLFDYAPTANATADYSAFVEEFLASNK